MSLVLNGTTGITSPGGDSAAVSVTTPLVTNAGTLALSATGANIVTASTNGSERMRITSAGNVGIGTSSPAAKLDVSSGALTGALIVGGDFNTTTGARTNATRKYAVLGVPHYTNAEEPMTFAVLNAGASVNEIIIGGGQGNLNAATSIEFYTAANNTTITGTERMRIDSSGNLLVGTTSLPSGGGGGAGFEAGQSFGRTILQLGTTTTSSLALQRFYNPNGNVGSISVSGSATTYATSSDYRLKEDWQPMSGAITRLNQLKPVNFAWKVDGSRVDGFLAHEAQEVVPEAVTGTKDAVDKDGKPEYQGIDQSKLVPLLTAALQEAVAEINSLKARLDAANL
jgi:hypothetical protein